jgi:hypothetical protein
MASPIENDEEIALQSFAVADVANRTNVSFWTPRPKPKR